MNFKIPAQVLPPFTEMWGSRTCLGHVTTCILLQLRVWERSYHKIFSNLFCYFYDIKL